MITDTPTLTGPTAPSEHSCPLDDGVELFYRAWLPAEPTNRALVLFHRGHEHSGRFADVVDGLALRNVAIFAWDQRGHGRSPGPRGWAESFGRLVRDADLFVRHICKEHGFQMQDIAVLAHSVGAVLASTWVHDYAPPIRALVLVTPALRVKLYVPLAIPGLRLLKKAKGKKSAFIKSYVKAKMLTHDPEQAKAYKDDPLIERAIAVNILLGLYDTSKRLIADAGTIRVPTLLMAGGADWVVKLSTQQRFYERLGSPRKRMRIFDGMYHDILHEKDRQQVLDEARTFLQEAFEKDEPPQNQADGDRYGYTRDEYMRLSRPLSLLSPKRWFYGVQGMAMKTMGKLSDGIRLGWESGFDSGRTLDYVYENKPKGSAWIGGIMDKSYLKSAGWNGIRARRLHLEQVIEEAIDRVEKSGRAVRIVDIATGCGRYVLEAMRRRTSGDIHAVLRDNTQANLDKAALQAREWDLGNVRVELGDAFDEESLATIEPVPNIAIVSGLWELFPDNDMVRRSLRGLARALKRDGGYLIYTGQPWHPQVEMIARVLINREKKPWVMRRRTTGELDDLVRAAGFEKLDMRIGESGIFTVSLAKI